MSKLRAGLPQSRSFGFVEFSDHSHALACLRELSINYNLYKKYAITGKSSILAEFTVENVRKVCNLKFIIFDFELNLTICRFNKLNNVKILVI